MNTISILAIVTHLFVNQLFMYFMAGFVYNKKYLLPIVLVYASILIVAYIIGQKEYLYIASKGLNIFYLAMSGLFLITYPIGLVFALTGGVRLALKITFMVYAPTALVVLSNYIVFKRL